MVYTKQQLWNLDIPITHEFLDLLESVGAIDEWPFTNLWNFRSTVDENTPPLFLYTESRDERNYVTYSRVYGGGGSGSAEVGVGARSLFETDLSDRLGTSERGKILDAFCKIEFCIDVMICIEMGVFSNKIEYVSIKNEFSEARDGLFSSVHKKINYLKHKKILMPETHKLLMKSKVIRNNLAHQYLPINGYGVTDKDLDRHGTYTKAIQIVFEATWVNLLIDYTKIQLPVLEWIIDQNIIGERIVHE